MDLTIEEVFDLPIIQHINNKTNRIWGDKINEVMGNKDKILEYTCNEEPLFTAFTGVNTTALYINPYIYNNGLDPAYEKFLKGVFRAKGGLDQKEVINFE